MKMSNEHGYNNARVTIVGLAASFLALQAVPAPATELGDLAQSMEAGTFAILETTGFRNGAILAPTGAENYITMFADSAEWDPIHRTVNFIGASHNDPKATYVQYRDATNSWTTLQHPVHDSIHGYDHNAIDTTNGDFFHRPFNSPEVHHYSQANGTWSEFSLPSGGFQITGALEYFPEMNSLVYVDSSIGVWSRNPSGGSWNKRSNALPMGEYHTFMEYNPVHKVVMFGGGQGNKAVYKMDASGNITRMKDAPVGLGVGTNESRISVDPVSGDYIVLRANQKMYSYDIDRDQWTELNVTYPTGNPANGTIEASLGAHGVIMYIHYDFDKSAIYLYKHSPSNGDPLPDPVHPDPPQDLRAQ